jgi:hypothetical protein
MAPERQIRIDSRFNRPQPHFIQTAAEPGHEVIASKIGQHRSAPQREGATEIGRAVRRQTPRNEALARLDQALEVGGVDRFGIDLQAISTRFGDQDAGRVSLGSLGFEHPPEMKYVGLNRRRISGRWTFPPQRISDLVHGNCAFPLRHQEGEHRPLLSAAEA